MPDALVNPQQIEAFIILFPDICFIIYYFLILAWVQYILFVLQFQPNPFVPWPHPDFVNIHGFDLPLQPSNRNLFPDFSVARQLNPSPKTLSDWRDSRLKMPSEFPGRM